MGQKDYRAIGRPNRPGCRKSQRTGTQAVCIQNKEKTLEKIEGLISIPNSFMR